MTLDLTAADAALKSLYKAENFAFSTFNDRPLLGILPKDEGFYGKNMPIVNQYANPMGVSSQFATAQANVVAPKIGDFLLTRVKQYAVCHIDGETMEAMSSDAGAFVTAAKAATDAQLQELANRIESYVCGTGDGVLGVIATTPAITAKTIALTNQNDIFRFEIGMKLQAAATATGAVIDSGATETVAGVDYNSATLTATSAAWNTVLSSLAVSNFLFVQGDAQNNSTAKCMAGFGGWIPATAPSSGDSWFGQDRSVSSRLYGVTVTSTGGLVKNALMDIQNYASHHGGRGDVAVLPPALYRTLLKELDSQTQYSKVAGDMGMAKSVQISYEGVTVRGSKGTMTVLESPKATANTAFCLTKASWKMCSIGQLVRWSTLDGQKIVRLGTSDGVEARFVSYHNLGCKVPGQNARVTIT